MKSQTPPAEHPIDGALVRRLIKDQHPDLAEQRIALSDEGWDNVTYRLGEELAVRLPRRQLAGDLIVNEQTWLPRIAGDLPISVPRPIRVGRPSFYYPWTWSIAAWLPGETADRQPLASDQATRLAEFLLALHRLPSKDAPANRVRGVPLAVRAQAVTDRLKRLQTATDLITPAVLNAWRQAIDVPPASESRLLHGDLHARNVLAVRGEITGVIDWGDITAGDVATDLAAVWMLFDEPSARRTCLDVYNATQAELARARGWAISFAAILLETGLVDHPRHAAMGRATFRRVSEDVDLRDLLPDVRQRATD